MAARLDPRPATGTPPGGWPICWRGGLDALRARVDAGDGDAAWRLADLLINQGQVKKRNGCAGSA